MLSTAVNHSPSPQPLLCQGTTHTLTLLLTHSISFLSVIPLSNELLKTVCNCHSGTCTLGHTPVYYQPRLIGKKTCLWRNHIHACFMTLSKWSIQWMVLNPCHSTTETDEHKSGNVLLQYVGCCCILAVQKWNVLWQAVKKLVSTHVTYTKSNDSINHIKH